MSSRKQPRSWGKHEMSKEIWFLPPTLLTLPLGALPPLPQELIMLKLGILLSEPTPEKSLRPSPNNFNFYCVVLWGTNPEVRSFDKTGEGVYSFIYSFIYKAFSFYFSVNQNRKHIRWKKSAWFQKVHRETSKNLLNHWSTAPIPREDEFSLPVDKPGWHLLSGLKKESSFISPFILCIKCIK